MSDNLNDIKDLQEQVIDLQTRLAYQEDTLNELNEVVGKQDQLIMSLQEQMRVLVQRYRDMAEAANTNPSAPSNVLDERPPHY